jgi:hypothetical protein
MALGFNPVALERLLEVFLRGIGCKALERYDKLLFSV